ncbi:hypothetical protein ANN_21791 [Periplaneta americana]|uniref:Uncharacterized protein n=1 Tax=Periplaneta americana TaxID=6978 RepID=A0ABQ8S6W1_PERAM|nr:hypothetical protein ANN_21791 [Periplaneta americana]
MVKRIERQNVSNLDTNIGNQKWLMKQFIWEVQLHRTEVFEKRLPGGLDKEVNFSVQYKYSLELRYEYDRKAS